MAHSDHAPSDHDRGGMDITDQRQTYSAFLNFSLWGSLLIGLLVLFLTLAFSVHLPWMPVLFLCALLGVVAGIAMKMPVSWYATVTGLTVFGLIAGGVSTLIAALS